MGGYVWHAWGQKNGSFGRGRSYMVCTIMKRVREDEDIEKCLRGYAKYSMNEVSGNHF
jgi:hypothetical protein